MVCLDPGEEINPCFVVPWIGLDLCKSQSLDDRLAQGMIDLSGMYLLHGGVQEQGFRGYVQVNCVWQDPHRYPPPW